MSTVFDACAGTCSVGYTDLCDSNMSFLASPIRQLLRAIKPCISVYSMQCSLYDV